MYICHSKNNPGNSVAGQEFDSWWLMTGIAELVCFATVVLTKNRIIKLERRGMVET
jgi:hypothetical protein